MRRTLTRDERDALWGSCRLALRGLSDIPMLIDKRGEGAREIADRYWSYMRLLDDIGWGQLDPRDSYRLTMSDDELERLLRKELGHAEGCLRDNADAFERSQWDAGAT